jgi:hypothetical protein
LGGGGGAEAAEDLHRSLDLAGGPGDQLHEFVVRQVVGARRGHYQAARGNPGKGEGVEALVAGDPLLGLGAALDEGRGVEVEARPLALAAAQEVKAVGALEAAGSGEAADLAVIFADPS